MTSINPIFKLFQWSYHVQIWHAQRKQSELGYILSDCFCNFEYIGLQKRLNIWGGGWNFLRFWRKNEVPSGQRESMEWDSEMTHKSLFLMHNLIFGNIFIHYNIFNQQNWSKSSRFFAYQYDGYNKLALLTLAIPKSHINLLKPTF